MLNDKEEEAFAPCLLSAGARECFTCVMSFIHMVPWNRNSYLHFSFGETEAERSYVTCYCPQVAGDRSCPQALQGMWLKAEKVQSRPEPFVLIVHTDQNLQGRGGRAGDSPVCQGFFVSAQKDLCLRTPQCQAN